MIKIFYTAAGNQIAVNDFAVFDNGKVLINPTKEGCLPGFKVAISISDTDSRFGDIIVNLDSLEPCIDFETGEQVVFDTVSALKQWTDAALFLKSFSSRAQFICFRDFIEKTPANQDELTQAMLRSNAAAVIAGAYEAVLSTLQGADFVVESESLSSVVDRIVNFGNGVQTVFKKAELQSLKKACSSFGTTKGIGLLTTKLLKFLEG